MGNPNKLEQGSEQVPKFAQSRPEKQDNWGQRSKGMVCSTCMFYVPKVREGSDDPVIQLQVGRCRRHAPTLGGWPVMKPGDFCGDHKLDEEKV